MIALHLVPAVGPVRIERLVRMFGSARAAVDAGERDLAEVHGIGTRLAARIVRWRASVDGDAELRRAAEVGARVLTWIDP